ncbi:MAG: four helix bundle protein [Acidobacteriaceae bacterium]
MTPEELRRRTKTFAIDTIRLFRSLPLRTDAQVVGKQLLRSATSVAANCRASQRARSHTEFLAKLGVVLEEADESVFWLEVLTEAEIVPPERAQALCAEARQLLAIFAASQKTARERYGKH